MRWKAQQVLWLTSPTFLLYHHLPAPLCIFWVLWVMKSRPCCPSWWGGYVLLRYVLTMPGWCRPSQTHTELAGVPGLLPSEISRVLPAALHCSALSCAGGTRSLNRNQLQTPLQTPVCEDSASQQRGWAALPLPWLFPVTALQGQHSMQPTEYQWCFFLACRVCLSSVWKNKKIRNRSE